MVESIINLDTLFQALADQTRRDILRRVSKNSLSISELAEPYDVSFAAIAKHVAVLEKAKLVAKHRNGKEQIVTIVPNTLHIAQEHIERYASLWNDRFNALETLLQTNK